MKKRKVWLTAALAVLALGLTQAVVGAVAAPELILITPSVAKLGDDGVIVLRGALIKGDDTSGSSMEFFAAPAGLTKGVTLKLGDPFERGHVIMQDLHVKVDPAVFTGTAVTVRVRLTLGKKLMTEEVIKIVL